MNAREREAARVGLEALDRVLLAAGETSADTNPGWQRGDPILGETPNMIAVKDGSAPIRLVFGSDLNVWVGPVSEVLLLDACEGDVELLAHGIEKVLRSSIACRSVLGGTFLKLTLPGEKPWRRMLSGPQGTPSTLQTFYAPYIRATARA